MVQADLHQRLLLTAQLGRNLNLEVHVVIARPVTVDPLQSLALEGDARVRRRSRHDLDGLVFVHALHADRSPEQRLRQADVGLGVHVRAVPPEVATLLNAEKSQNGQQPFTNHLQYPLT